VSVMIRGRSIIMPWCIPSVLCVCFRRSGSCSCRSCLIGTIGDLKLSIVFDRDDRGFEVADHV
jgi:hypothetical protein